MNENALTLQTSRQGIQVSSALLKNQYLTQQRAEISEHEENSITTKNPPNVCIFLGNSV
jgi:hypothetical protein